MAKNKKEKSKPEDIRNYMGIANFTVLNIFPGRVPNAYYLPVARGGYSHGAVTYNDNSSVEYSYVRG